MNRNEEDKTDNQNGLKGKEIETEILGIKCIQANHSFTFRLPSEESKSYVIGAEHSSYRVSDAIVLFLYYPQKERKQTFNF